jgi:RNA polymerase sigma-70 factor (ECF subfamily)
MSHKEIALLLNINEKSSASQLARAKMALAQRVKEWIRLNS